MHIKVTSEATNPVNSTVKGPKLNMGSRDVVEGLVLEIKKNLCLSTSALKAIPCSHISRKSSRASPYRIPSKLCCNSSFCDQSCVSKSKHKHKESEEDPYELLQKLLKDGSLVSEAVRRVQLGITIKERLFYESDEDPSSINQLYFQDSKLA